MILTEKRQKEIILQSLIEKFKRSNDEGLKLEIIEITSEIDKDLLHEECLGEKIKKLGQIKNELFDFLDSLKE